MAYCLEGDLIKYSGNYGAFDFNSTYFVDSQDVGGTQNGLLRNKIQKIKIYPGTNNNKEIITGIQLTYINKYTKEIKELPIRKGKKDYEDEEIETFEINPGEYLINFYIRFPDDGEYIHQIGFETNKKRKILKGSEKGNEKNVISNGGDNIIVGTFGYFSTKLDSCGVLYINLKEYFKRLKIAFFELKFKLKKDEKYRKEIDSKYETFSESDKYLFKACLLPDTPFTGIMKFCIL